MASKRPLISRKPSKDVQDISESDTKSYAKLQSVPESSSTDALSNEELDRLSLSVQDKQIIQEARRERKPNKQFRDVKFKPGTTAFDRHNPERSGSFAGFFSLFWLGLFFLWVKTLAEHWRETGHFIRGDLVILYQLDALQLAVTDLIMVSSSVFVVILQYFALKGLSWHRFGWIIQHVWQTSYLAIVVHKSYTNNWQWLQSVFIVLHCVVMLMKQYSYATYMGYLSEVYKARNRLEKKLMKLRSADAPRLKVQPPSPAEEKSKKDASLASDTQGPLETEEEERLLLAEIEELNDELTHDGVTYPENLTLRNYIDYLLVPSLVYDIVYPRTERIRWWYVLEKTLATLGTFGLMTMIAEFYIIAVIPTNLKTMTTNEKLTELPWLMLRVVFPFLVLYLLTFYIIFECICQWFAEITCFADRTFYNDWWNSRSWDDFARDWNVPVHRFLLRHVYHSSMSVLNVKKQQATLITFFLSSLVHEMVMACMTKKIRVYLLTSQMLQLPLVVLMRTKFFKQNPAAANVFFWLGLFCGPSFLCLAYVLF